MIITKLQGGVGNQMFQYAAGKNLAFKYKKPLLLDLSFFNNIISYDGFTPRKFELEIFDIDAGIASPQILRNIFSPGLFKKIGRKTIKRGVKIYKETDFSGQVKFAEQKYPIYLEGYWQALDYFKDTSEIIRHDFLLKDNNLLKEYDRVLREITSGNSIALHVRRGDYVKYAVTNQIHGICPLSYYKKALSHIQKSVQNSEIYVFSDDHDWIKENFDFEYNLFESGVAQLDSVELYLMSRCKHNIISNSSFSWWAAWLNSNPQKIVVAPERWFNTPPQGFNINNLIPSEWIKL